MPELGRPEAEFLPINMLSSVAKFIAQKEKDLTFEKIKKPMPLIVFDFGGVLVDWNPYHLYLKLLGNDPQAVGRFLEEVDFPAWNLENDRGRPFSQGIAELVARFPHYANLVCAYDERFLESVSGPIQPVVEILYQLKDRGYPLYGLSNWPAEKFALMRSTMPFFECFDGMIISGEVGLVKPDPAIFQLLLARAGRSAADCVFIDDHHLNIAAASGLGFQTIHFQSPQQLVDELRRMGILNGVL